MLTLVRHEQLDNFENPAIGWSSKRISKAELRAMLPFLRCIELRIDGLRPQHAPYRRDEAAVDASRQHIDLVIRTFTESGFADCYLVLVSDRMPKSRVKTYKGVFGPKSAIRGGDYYQAEIEDQGQSFFVGIARIVDENRAECLRLATYNGFLMFTELKTTTAVRENISAALMAAIRFSGVQIRGKIFLDFSNLVPGIVHDNQWLIRYGYDRAGDDWMNLAIFVSHSIEQRVAQTLDGVCFSIHAR